MTFVDAFQQVLLDRQKDNRMQTIGKAMEKPNAQGSFEHLHRMRKSFPRSLENQKFIEIPDNSSQKSAGLAGVSSGVGLDDGLLVCTLLLLI